MLWKDFKPWEGNVVLFLDPYVWIMKDLPRQERNNNNIEVIAGYLAELTIDDALDKNTV